MLFRKQFFLGQVTLGQKTPSGTSTYTAQELCKALAKESKNPGSATKEVAALWGNVSGVKWMEDEVYSWMDKWCPQYKMLLGFTVAKAAGLQRPVPPKPAPTPGPPVATPGTAQASLYTLCYQCGPGVYKKMLPMDAQAQGCKLAKTEDCNPKPVATPGSGQSSVSQCYQCGPGSYKKMLPIDASVQGCKVVSPDLCKPTPPVYPPVATRSAFNPQTKPTVSTPQIRTYTRPMTMRPSLTDLLPLALTAPSSSFAPLTSMPTTSMPMMSAVRLGNMSGQAEDQAWFEANRAQIAQQYPNQYVIVKDLAVRGAYPDFQSAYNAGLQMFGTQPFEVKKAEAQQSVETA